MHPTTMPRIRSFKAQYRQAPPRAVTPSPPVYEPLSPLLLPSMPSLPHSTSTFSTASSYHSACPNGTLEVMPGFRETDRSSEMPMSLPISYSSPRHPTPNQYPLPSPALPMALPIEALVNANVSSPRPGYAFHDHLRGTHQNPASPPTLSYQDIERAAKRAYAMDAFDGHYLQRERPAKRARSEFHGSPTHGQPQSRPATSHIPGWSYNLERMVDNGVRMLQDSGSSIATQRLHTSGNDRLSDAQLLLDFCYVSTFTAQSPPSTAKRWSVSHIGSAEQVPLLGQKAQESESVHQPVSHAKHPPQTAPAFTGPPVLEKSSQLQTVAEADSVAPALTISEIGTEVILPSAPLSGPLVEEVKPKKHQGWPKGKPRGPRSTTSSSKRKKSTPKPRNIPQARSPRSLSVEQSHLTSSEATTSLAQILGTVHDLSLQSRRHSFSDPSISRLDHGPPSTQLRAKSLPLGVKLASGAVVSETFRSTKRRTVEQPDLICAACKSSDSDVKVGDGEQWIGCDGCKEWYHYACAGFNSEREVRDVNRFYCEPCRPKFGETTKVRKSVRAHTTVDYAGLNEGVLKTSDDNPEHHYIAAFKNGDIDFTPETFARMPPELITSDYLEKTNGFKEPILIPASLNPRPHLVEKHHASPFPADYHDLQQTEPNSHFDLEIVVDDGQDKLDMVIPKGLTVRRVAELYGPNEPVPVIDVKAQEGEGKKWTMNRWAEYYEQQGEKPVRNVISLEVSRSRLGKLIRRPRAVRGMDLQDSVWRKDDKTAPPPVQFYCLMSVADCFTDFHIDFGGSSVYYHIVKGRKVFFFIPPTKQNLKKYEDWCLSPNQGHDWLGKQVKECYRVDLYPGDTMLIPSGWIHAVWTPQDSLVIGGNFLTRIHYGMQIKVLEIEKNTEVALQFRYPFFQKIMWLTVIKYLEDDPLPEQVQQLLQSNNTFARSVPVYCEPDRFGHNSHLGSSKFNRRYYSKHELDGLTDLLNYIWRTVLISLEKIDVPQKTRSAVMKSIPKGHGDPLVLARRFAMWIAWKRGNEPIPEWAFAEAGLPEPVEVGEKKLSSAQLKRLERESMNEVLRPTAERSSARIRAADALLESSPPPLFNNQDLEYQLDPMSGPLTGFLRPSANNPHITTPKTSQLGPKRVACDACRRRRIRCKHKDELIDTSKPGMHTIDLSGSYGISVKRRLSDHSIADSLSNDTTAPTNGGPIMADVNGDPYALKSGRVKACADCRKSKRRCVHDEYGNVDPIKANEIPIPRGSASKKRRVSNEDSLMLAKRMKYENSYDDDYLSGDMLARQSMMNEFDGGSFLQDLAYSAQQALAHSIDDDLMPIDPALQMYNALPHSPMDSEHQQVQNIDNIMSSVEYQSGDHLPIGGMDVLEEGRKDRGPSIEPPTPRPVLNTDTHILPNRVISTMEGGFDLKSRAISPISPTFVPATSIIPEEYMSATTSLTNDHSELVMPSKQTHLPANHGTPASRLTRGTTTLSYKPIQTPLRIARNIKTPKNALGGRRRDSKENIKQENGASNAMHGLIDPNLDQASIDLIKQLQQEDLGLRRRSR